MKKIAMLCLCLILLAGCAGQDPATVPSTQSKENQTANPGTSHTTMPAEITVPSTEPSSSPTHESTIAPPLSFQLYYPNERMNGYLTAEITMAERNPDQIIQHLIEYEVLVTDVKLNSIQIEGTQLNLDLNESFLMQIYSMGSIGEAMLMGSLLRTFLRAYDCESMMVTVDSEIIHSGHVDYDTPLRPVD